MRILVTGVTGQVGSALMRSLHPHGELVPADRGVLDLTKPRELASRLDALRPDMIVNPAAYTAVDRAEDERDIAFVINGESPGVIARLRDTFPEIADFSDPQTVFLKLRELRNKW